MEDNCENNQAELETQGRRQYHGINLLPSEWKWQIKLGIATLNICHMSSTEELAGLY